ncbi:unnamed protein product [Dovyalis caffra]|uniref:CCR4-NOT transcription complex subunit 4 n=1 Tax=Dovyalis caffra TaxID=77055 RepID=A0AAV1R9V9_9ROSI|nr:unnamed protein product [Dovyalis caffra]
MSDEGERTCPLCAEEMDLTDQQLKPCKCGYEICVWCWHHIMDMAEKDDTEGRCPACRLPYDKEKIVGTAGDCERLVAEINIERKKSHKAKTKPYEGRKQLSSVRVIQRNLVYIVGLPLNLADEDLLQHKEYFGQYGKVLKVSMSRTAAGVVQQFPNSTCSVYITYSREEEAIRCIQSVHGFVLDGRSLKACFGTTKYCHAWLRNVPCTNPDCLYLHEIGSQEDSFTKDEIISAYTRSRVQQITGAPNSMLWRSGSMLPPPADDYCNNSSASAAKPIVKNASDNIMSTGQGSPPTGSGGRSVALPAAASWGMRASNQPQATSLTYSNGPSKPKPDTSCGVLAFSSAVASTSQTSTLHSDVGRRVTCNEESRSVNGKGKLDLKTAKHHVGLDCQAAALEKPVINDSTATVTLSSQLSSPLPSKYNGWDLDVLPNVANSTDETQQSRESDKEGISIPNGNFQNLLSGHSSMRVDSNTRSELSGVIRTGSLPDGSMIKSPGNQVLQPPYAEQYCKPLTPLATERTGALENVVCASNEQLDWRTDEPKHAVRSTVSEVEEDILAFGNQRLKDPEVSHLPNLASSPHVPNHSRSNSLQHSEPFGSASLSSNPQYADNRVGDLSLLHSSSNCITSNGYPEKLVSRSAFSDRNIEHSFSLPNGVEGKNVERSLGDADSNGALDVGESSIISNILSLDLDSWDDSLTSPQNLAKLLSETDKQPSSLKMSSSWKVQNNNNQSRFSFARQEELRSQTLGVDPSFNVFGKLPKNYSSNQDFGENRNSYLGKLGNGNSFSSSSFDEPENFPFGPSAFSSNRPPISRAQISAPPGFSVPSRAPPPGFSSHERMEQSFDAMSGNHLLDPSSFLRNSCQAPPTGNSGSTGEIEFMDPAILAVGKGRLQGGLNNPVVDMRSNFPQQLHHFDNEARLQLLMQRSLPPHQNIRYADIGDSFSSLSDSFGISSRLVDQSQISGLSPFAQLSLQQSRNGLMSNGRWDGWNEVQGGNSLRMAELLRNERLGFNKFYSSGYEESKFRMPSSDNLYNRTFEM